MPKGQAHVGQRFALLCGVAKHPIVTYLGRIERSEERSDLSGYDEQALILVPGCSRAKTSGKRGG